MEISSGVRTLTLAETFTIARGSTDTEPRYQFWDLEGKKKPLNIPLREGEILGMTLLDETFEPAEIITWAFKPGAWLVPRDWAEFS